MFRLDRFAGLALCVVPVLASVYSNCLVISLLPIKVIESNLPEMWVGVSDPSSLRKTKIKN